MADHPSFDAAELFGRASELDRSLRALDDAFHGRGRLVLISGEAGIGKTALADQLASRARTRGARVLWGRSWEAGGAPAYWPWIQAIRTYVREIGHDAAREHLSSEGAFVAQILPELEDLAPTLATAPTLDPDGARFRLFSSVAALLTEAAASTPILLILEDLHAADASSLTLLRFVAQQLDASRLLLVATYRDIDIDLDQITVAPLADLAREPRVEHVQLAGLSQDDVANLVRGLSRSSPSASMIATIHRETEGNPLFIAELVHLLAEEGTLNEPGDVTHIRRAIPASLRETIDRRLDQLSVRCREILDPAAVIGRDFDLRALERVARVASDELLGLLDEASESRIVSDMPPSPGRMRFSHAVVRDALYEAIPPGRRAQLHAAIGETLERLYGADIQPHMAELAHHFFEAAPRGDPTKAVDYARRAADHATASFAYEEAARLYGVALHSLDLIPEADAGLRCETLLGLGDAQARAGDRAAAEETFRAAAAIARDPERADQLARAALGYGGRFVWEAGRGDPYLAGLLEDALRASGEHDGPLKARVMARLSGGPLRDDVSRERRDALSREAVEIARRSGDPATLAYCLDGRYAAVWWPENLDERLSIATELIGAAEQAGDLERALQGYHYRCVCHLERGDRRAVAADLRAQERLAEDLRQPVHRWYVAMVRTMLATFEGRLSDAEELLPVAFELGVRAHGSIMHGYRLLQLYALRREQGRLRELVDGFRESVDAFPTYLVLRCALVAALAELGEASEARGILHELAMNGFALFPRNDEWLFGMCLLAEVVAYLEEHDAAEELERQLRPFADRIAVSPVNACIGSVARPLGLLAATLGRFEQADRYLEDAVEVNRQAGARPWVARSLVDRATVLLSGEVEEAHVRAGALLELARSEAAAAGLASLAERATELLGHTGGVPRVVRTFMFTDIVGSTALIDAIGDEAWEHLRRWHDGTLRSCFAASGGEEVDHAGDGFFVAFTSPRDAFTCATSIQRRLDEHRRSQGFAPQVRIGVHTAEATRTGERYGGMGVHEAARIGTSAEGGQILSSLETATGVDELRHSEPWSVGLKGVPGPMQVVSIKWR